MLKRTGAKRQISIGLMAAPMLATVFMVSLPPAAAEEKERSVAVKQKEGLASLSSSDQERFKPYLGGGGLPDSTIYSPPPPAQGSVDELRDRDGAARGVAQRGTPRWNLAVEDADLRPGHTAKAFSCAAGFTINAQQSPLLDRMMGRILVDLGLSTRDVKKRYMRPRPFMENGQPSCTPALEKALAHDGSYPSGHSAIGFGTALVLAEIMPDRAAQLVARGRAFGESRRICNVHWLSDIEEGRMVAAATVMRLNADPAFVADLNAARDEVSKLRAGPGKLVAPDCSGEQAALAPVAEH